MARKVIIVGAGSTGFQLAKQLVADNQDVTLIEHRQARNQQSSLYGHQRSR